MSGNTLGQGSKKNNIQEPIMSNLNLSLVAGYSVDSPALSKPVTLPPMSLSGFLRRILRSHQAAKLRRAEAEVARYIQNNGGVLTDEIERQIGCRFGG